MFIKKYSDFIKFMLVSLTVLICCIFSLKASSTSYDEFDDVFFPTSLISRESHLELEVNVNIYDKKERIIADFPLIIFSNTDAESIKNGILLMIQNKKIYSVTKKQKRKLKSFEKSKKRMVVIGNRFVFAGRQSIYNKLCNLDQPVIKVYRASL